MYVAPNSVVYLLAGVPLNKKYEHTIAPLTKSGQLNDFLQYRIITTTALQYVRKNRSLKLPYSADSLYKCNYMIFQNTPFGEKYYYAFIDSIEYISNEVCEVFFTIDVMQTYWFDFNFLPCFVVREHSETDEIGVNTIHEPVSTPEFLHYSLSVANAPFTKGEYSVVIAQGTEQIKVNDRYESVIDNVFSGIDYKFYRDPTDAYEALKAINNAGDSSTVVGVYQVPSVFISGNKQDNFNDMPSVLLNISGGGLKNIRRSSFAGFIPKNNKLFTKQFFGLYCESSSGASKKYAIEYFDNPDDIVFGIGFCIAGSPTCSLYPNNYGSIIGANYLEELVCADFPMCSWVADSFTEYLALNSGKLVSGIASETLNATQNSLSRQASGVNSQTASNIFSTVGSLWDASVAPDKVHHEASFGFNYSRGLAGFKFYNYYLRRDYAEIVDDFFTMFGYQTNKIKVPGIRNRPKFNYVKTEGCTIKGAVGIGLPTDAIDLICSIVDGGITFWNKLNIVGDYSQDNSPIISQESGDMSG